MQALSACDVMQVIRMVDVSGYIERWLNVEAELVCNALQAFFSETIYIHSLSVRFHNERTQLKHTYGLNS